jgi:hypothetical protein
MTNQSPAGGGGQQQSSFWDAEGQPRKADLTYGGLADGQLKSSQHSIFRGAKLEPGSFVNVWELMLMPWILLCFVLVSFLFVGDSTTLYAVPLVLTFLCIAVMQWSLKKGHTAEVVLWLLCLVAIIAAALVGFYANSTLLSEYWRMSRGSSYFNVYPAEPAAAYQDATTMMFSLDTGVDSGRTYGFVDGRTEASTLYCVAPIASAATSLVTNRIQYWAAGIGCCYPRSDFICGDAKNSTARGAIVLPKSQQHNPFFMAAVEGAQFAYGIAPAEQYIFVEWKADPIMYHSSLWSKAKKLFLIFGGVYLLISILVGVVVVPILKAFKE